MQLNLNTPLSNRRFVVTRFLAQDDRGYLYECHDCVTNRPALIKEYFTSSCSRNAGETAVAGCSDVSGKEKTEFVNECQALAGSNFAGTFEDNGTIYCVWYAPQQHFSGQPLGPQQYRRQDKSNNTLLIGIAAALGVLIIAAVVVYLLFFRATVPDPVAEPADKIIVLSQDPQVTYNLTRRVFEGPNGAKMKMVQIPGTSSYIADTECPQWLWQAVAGNNPSPAAAPTLPVTNVSWTEINRFNDRLSQITDCHFVLPTDSQWSAAANDGNIYSGSNNLDDVGWYKGNAHGQIQSVGQKAANAHGIYDMSGNVFELTREKHGRGGSVNFGQSQCYITYVNYSGNPTVKWPDLGFRLALETK